MRKVAAVLAGMMLLAMAGAAPAASVGFSNWAAVVVAGDYSGAHGGGDTEAFDNARRDVARTLVDRMGFSPDNVRQFSVRPDRYSPRPERSTLFTIQNTLKSMASRSKDGCLVYFTSHGAEYGAFLNAEDRNNATIILPPIMAEMVNSACPDRPTIVIISTCFSGVNVPALKDENRLVMTAARKDRSSFGCGESNVYPYFDQCFLEASKSVKNFAALPPAVVSCVSRMEQETGMSPPSEPQVWIGASMRPMLALYGFRRSD
ncbi:MAG: caspase family protein [Caulobacter sp.]|nr:caspase family protein [Caulobacter sp.]